jgi:5,10-methenyltetrahydromethanopterin hydrogenase
VVSDIVSEDCIITADIAIKMAAIMTIINVIVNDIRRKVPKPEAHALKKSEPENPELCLRTLPNKPPARNALIMKLIISTYRVPEETDDTMVLKVGPRSVKTSGSMPFTSFSVIMLLPNAAVRDPFRGIEIAEARIKRTNQTTRTPFQALSDL